MNWIELNYYSDTHFDQRRGQVPILTQVYRQSVRSVYGGSALVALYLKQVKSETLADYNVNILRPQNGRCAYWQCHPHVRTEVSEFILLNGLQLTYDLL